MSTPEPTPTWEEIRYPGLAACFDRSAGRLVVFARRLDPHGSFQDAEDRVAETFARMTEKWPIEQPVAYAYRTVRNLTVDHWRRSKTKPETPDSPCVEESSSGLSPAQLVLSDEGELAVWRAVRELPRPVQDVFVLHYIEEMTIAEVAESLGLPLRRTYHYRDRIRAKVRALLSETGETEDPDPNAP